VKVDCGLKVCLVFLVYLHNGFQTAKIYEDRPIRPDCRIDGWIYGQMVRMDDLMVGGMLDDQARSGGEVRIEEGTREHIVIHEKTKYFNRCSRNWTADQGA
jgi:hypothetical protein